MMEYGNRVGTAIRVSTREPRKQEGGPKIVTVMVDGVLNHGGEVRDYGWGRFDPTLGDVNGKTQPPVAPAIFGEMKQLRIYNRYLRTSELVSNWRAGMV